MGPRDLDDVYIGYSYCGAQSRLMYQIDLIKETLKNVCVRHKVKEVK